MLRTLPFLIQLALMIYTLVECIQTDDDDVRNLPKWGWIALIVLVPFAGAIAWLFAGRPQALFNAPGSEVAPPPRMIAPDDDPEFLESLNRSNLEHENMLKSWEEDLRRREHELRDRPDEGPSPDGPQRPVG